MGAQRACSSLGRFAACTERHAQARRSRLA